MPPETPTSRASAMDTGLDCAQLYALGLQADLGATSVRALEQQGLDADRARDVSAIDGIEAGCGRVALALKGLARG